MPIQEEELQARVRQDVMFLSKPEEIRETPLTRDMRLLIKQAVSEHGREPVQLWLDALKGEVGPVRMARIAAMLEAEA